MASPDYGIPENQHFVQEIEYNEIKNLEVRSIVKRCQ